MSKLGLVVLLAVLWGAAILFFEPLNGAARSFDCAAMGFSPLGGCR